MEVGCKSDIGKRKSVNEDSCGSWFSTIDGEDRGIFVVADGVGGEEKGEVASRMAVSNTIEKLHPLLSKGALPGKEDLQTHIKDAIKRANEQIISYAEERDLSKIATTITMAVVCGETAIMANVGDSRTYLYRDGALHQVTKDHSLLQSLVDQGKLSQEDIKPPRSEKAKRQENVVTQVLGNEENIDPDLYTERMVKGDRVLLCCDGLTDLVLESKIADTLDTMESSEDACSRLVDLANDQGGKDNITVMVANPSDLPAEEHIMEKQTVIKED